MKYCIANWKMNISNPYDAVDWILRFSKKLIKKIIPENKSQKIIMLGKNSIFKTPLFLE